MSIEYGRGLVPVRAIPAIEPKPPLGKVDVTREYVAGGRLWWYPDTARRLPWSIDDISADFGDDIYERMLHDPQVKACGQILKKSIIEDGVYLRPAVDDADDPDYEQAKSISEHLQRQLDEQEVSLDDALNNMLDAAFYGNKVAEVKWEFGKGPKGMHNRVLNPVALKVKPREATSFVVDAYMNIVGLYATSPTSSVGTVSGSTIIKPDDPNLLPRTKFAVLTWEPRDGDPRGTSVLRSAYDPWWRKRQIIVEYMRYMTQFAGPSVIGYTAESASLGAQADPLGNVVTDPVTGQMVPALTPEEQMLSTLLAWRNGLAAAFPYGSKVEVVQPAGDGSAFLKGLLQADQQITKAILTQELATEQGEHQTRAAATVHQDVLATIVRQGKKSVQRMIFMDVLRRWVIMNIGDDALHLTPFVSLGTTEEEDKSPKMNAVAALQRSGYLDMSQYPGIDEILGLPARDMRNVDPATMPAPSGSTSQPGAVPPPAPGAGAVGPQPARPAGARPAAPAGARAARVRTNGQAA